MYLTSYMKPKRSLVRSQENKLKTDFNEYV